MGEEGTEIHDAKTAKFPETEGSELHDAKTAKSKTAKDSKSSSHEASEDEYQEKEYRKEEHRGEELSRDYAPSSSDIAKSDRKHVEERTPTSNGGDGGYAPPPKYGTESEMAPESYGADDSGSERSSKAGKSAKGGDPSGKTSGSKATSKSAKAAHGADTWDAKAKKVTSSTGSKAQKAKSNR